MTKIDRLLAKCPACGHEQQCTIYGSVNVKESPELKQVVLDDEINTFLCENCEYYEKLLVELMYHDMEKKFVVWLKPNGLSQHDVESNKRFAKTLGSDSYFVNTILAKNRQEFIELINRNNAI